MHPFKKILSYIATVSLSQLTNWKYNQFCYNAYHEMWICSNAINTLGTIWAKQDFEFAYDYDVVSKLQIPPAFLLFATGFNQSDCIWLCLLNFMLKNTFFFPNDTDFFVLFFDWVNCLNRLS